MKKEKGVMVSSSARQGKTFSAVPTNNQLHARPSLPAEWTDILRSWRLWAQVRDLSAGTVELYEAHIKSFFRWLRPELAYAKQLQISLILAEPASAMSGLGMRREVRVSKLSPHALQVKEVPPPLSLCYTRKAYWP
jgi:hypothetical protein